MSAITDPANRVTTLGYSSGRLQSIQDSDGSLWRYTYDSSNRMTTIKTPLSQTNTVTYDGFGRVSSIKRADNTTESFSPMQEQGLVAVGQGTAGNPATRVLAAQASASYTDALSHKTTTRTDWLGFGRAEQVTRGRSHSYLQLPPHLDRRRKTRQRV